MSTHRKALFLYTELAPYFLACVDRLVRDHNVEAHIVRWPVNREAPFDLRFADRVKVYERDAYDDQALLRLAHGVGPDITFASGWVDKGYLRVCRMLYKQGLPTVMCSDTAWRGDARQWAAVAATRLWLRRTFSHAWVTGEAQARYARRLGFPSLNIRTGFYSADTDRFLPLGQELLDRRALHWPHRLLCVARYIPSKGHQMLCDVFAKLSDDGLAGDWELWIAGTGELHEAVTRSPSGRHPRIRHLGFVQVEEMPQVLEQCGVFVLPSTYEPWGVVVHEHACAGFPLLLSSAVGAGERFLGSGENGVRFAGGDATDMRNALRQLVQCSDAQLRAMGERSHALGAKWTPADWARVVMDLMKARREA
ncbi:MAG: glycosyltransferase family 4 protein [Flavobacteriales bacterium]|nr:glycosyltransferase family 4 protein [Flavobacteriales bacterium]